MLFQLVAALSVSRAQHAFKEKPMVRGKCDATPSLAVARAPVIRLTREYDCTSTLLALVSSSSSCFSALSLKFKPHRNYELTYARVPREKHVKYTTKML